MTLSMPAAILTVMENLDSEVESAFRCAQKSFSGRTSGALASEGLHPRPFQCLLLGGYDTLFVFLFPQ